MLAKKYWSQTEGLKEPICHGLFQPFSDFMYHVIGERPKVCKQVCKLTGKKHGLLIFQLLNPIQ